MPRWTGINGGAMKHKCVAARTDSDKKGGQMIRQAMASIKGIWKRAGQSLTAPPFVALSPFRSKPAPVFSLLGKTLFFSFCVFLGVFYGFWGTVLPPAFIILLIIPFLIFALLVLWLLPDTGDAPERTLKRLLLALALSPLIRLV
jgi:hypothetical protein